MKIDPAVRAQLRLVACALLVLVATAANAAATSFATWGVLDSSAPVPGQGFTSAITGQIPGARLNRPGGTAATCAVATASPGTLGAGPYRFDRFRFTATTTGCVTFSLRNSGPTGQAQFAVYSSFNPADVVSGLLADSRAGALTGFVRSLSLLLTAGQSYDVVVSDSFANVETTEYELVVSDQTGFSAANPLNSVDPQWGFGYFNQISGQIPGTRLFRTSVPSVCGVAKVNPGTSGAGPFRFHALTFTATKSECLNVTVLQTGGTGLAHVTLYSTFNPADVSAGYLADSGTSSAGAPESLGYSVTAGQSYTVVVSESTANVETTSYSLTAAGLDPSNRISTTIPSSGPASLYPSTVNIAGLRGTVTGVSVTLHGLSHTFPADLDVLLVAPDGRAMVVMSDVGGGVDVNDIDLTLTDSAATAIPSVLTAGTYRPTSPTDGDAFDLRGLPPPPLDCVPAGECAHPAPAGAATLNGVFGGAAPNGAWHLYVVDDAAVDAGGFIPDPDRLDPLSWRMSSR